jgi:hypothetical protein
MFFNFMLALFDTFQKLFEVIDELFVDFAPLMTMAIVILIIIVVLTVVVTSFSIEITTNRAVNKINRYLEKKPFVNEENLVEFNNLMKTIPKPMRYEWQQYMLNRDKLPSNFMTQVNCIDRPFRSSSYDQTIAYAQNVILIFTMLFAVIGFALAREATEVMQAMFSVSIIPAVFFVFGTMVIMMLRARRKAVVADLYYNFDYMLSSLDRGIETIPAFVDYEILFSRKEIKQGIPALQDYLEKRALFEQEQLERAKKSTIEHDKYDFSALDINGSLVMERAMREAEYYLGNRSRLRMEIEQLESEKDSHTRAFAENTKALQRKLRDIKENLERLRDSLANVTNKIDANYIRKQQEDEVKKQQTLEKEVATITNRYNKDIATIDEEIARRNKEMSEQRSYLEKAMNGEFNEYSKKVYDQLNEIVEERSKQQVEQLKAEKRELEEELDTANTVMVEKEVLFKEKLEEANKQAETLKKKDEEIALKEEFIKGQNARIRELESGKVIERYFDANGNEFFYDGEGTPYYKDASGNIIYYDKEEEVEEVEEVEEAPKKEAPKKTTTTKKSTTTTKKPAAKK